MLEQLLSSRLPGFQIEDIQQSDTALVLSLRPAAPTARCSLCQNPSSHVQSRYQRVLADLPALGLTVQIQLHVRRFFCVNPACPRQVFCERLPDLAEPRARCSRRLADLQRQIALEVGGEVGARLLQRLAMPGSPDTLLRRCRQQALTVTTPRVLGVDDYAVRKGQTYGTILVDLERHCPVDLLPDRSAASLADWLQRHPGVEVIARDRATDYADGARRGAPQAIQVADRFHLLQNVQDMLQRMMERQQGLLRQVMTDAHSAPIQDQTVQEPIASDEARLAPEGTLDRAVASPPSSRPGLHRAERLARYEAVKALQAQGLGGREIARQLSLGRPTVYRWLTADQFPERGSRRARPSKLDPFVAYLEQQLAAGHDNGMQLWRELRDHQGYIGSRALVSRWVARHRHLCPPAPSRPKRRGRPPAPVASPPPKRRLSARQAAWLLMRPPTDLDAEEQALVERLCQAEREVQIIYALAQEFNQIVRRQQADAFDDWLARAGESAIRELCSFVAGLQRDHDAVLAALCLPYSTGQVEGQINRLKMIKRSMYGRANHDLLRQRVLAA